MFKSIKKAQKWGILCAGPRGCDVARKATWTRVCACVARMWQVDAYLYLSYSIL